LQLIGVTPLIGVIYAKVRIHLFACYIFTKRCKFNKRPELLCAAYIIQAQCSSPCKRHPHPCTPAPPDPQQDPEIFLLWKHSRPVWWGSTMVRLLHFWLLESSAGLTDSTQATKIHGAEKSRIVSFHWHSHLSNMHQVSSQHLRNPSSGSRHILTQISGVY
jgi:hypothetical protein